MEPLLEFLCRLEAAGIHYHLGHYRESINVQVTVPGERWEVEFFADGTVEVEVFISSGGVTSGVERLELLFREPEAPLEDPHEPR
jgi:hypothetical protein